MPKPNNERGAANTAKRLEEHEAEAERLFSELTAKIPTLWSDYNAADGNDDKQKAIAHQIESIQKQADTQFKRWMDLSKQVREFYKSVAEEKRDGEKMLRSDVEEYWKQFMLSIDLAIQSHGITIAQEACRAESPAEFLRANEESWASCKRAQLDAAVRDGKLPSWFAL